MTVTVPTDALSEEARKFVAGPHQLLIAGERSPAADGRTFDTIDPATGEAIAAVAYAGPQDVDAAGAAARAAFADGPWHSAPAAERGRLLGRLADLLEDNAGELAEIESLDKGKPVKLVQIVDVAQAVAHLRYFAGWPSKIEGEV